jgi:hypothetical protein
MNRNLTPAAIEAGEHHEPGSGATTGERVAAVAAIERTKAK